MQKIKEIKILKLIEDDSLAYNKEIKLSEQLKEYQGNNHSIQIKLRKYKKYLTTLSKSSFL